MHSDHRALHWLFTMTEPSARLARWRLILAEFTFSIAYKKGKDNHHANEMSRLLIGSPNTTDDGYDDIPVFSLENEITRKPSDPTESDENNDFTEVDYDPLDQILAIQEERTNHVHFDQITIEELISAQLHDAFCSDGYRRINEGRVYPSISTKTDCLSGQQLPISRSSSHTL